MMQDVAAVTQHHLSLLFKKTKMKKKLSAILMSGACSAMIRHVHINRSKFLIYPRI